MNRSLIPRFVKRYLKLIGCVEDEGISMTDFIMIDFEKGNYEKHYSDYNYDFAFIIEIPEELREKYQRKNTPRFVIAVRDKYYNGLDVDIYDNNNSSVYDEKDIFNNMIYYSFAFCNATSILSDGWHSFNREMIECATLHYLNNTFDKEFNYSDLEIYEYLEDFAFNTEIYYIGYVKVINDDKLINLRVTVFDDALINGITHIDAFSSDLNDDGISVQIYTPLDIPNKIIRGYIK